MKDKLYDWLCYHGAGVWLRLERRLFIVWRGIGMRMEWLNVEDYPLTMTDARSIPYAPGVRCEDCGALGAYDFMGDWLCARCAGTEQGQDE